MFSVIAMTIITNARSSNLIVVSKDWGDHRHGEEPN